MDKTACLVQIWEDLLRNDPDEEAILIVIKGVLALRMKAWEYLSTKSTSCAIFIGMMRDKSLSELHEPAWQRLLNLSPACKDFLSILELRIIGYHELALEQLLAHDPMNQDLINAIYYSQWSCNDSPLMHKVCELLKSRELDKEQLFFIFGYIQPLREYACEQLMKRRDLTRLDLQNIISCQVHTGLGDAPITRKAKARCKEKWKNLDSANSIVSEAKALSDKG